MRRIDRNIKRAVPLLTAAVLACFATSALAALANDVLNLSIEQLLAVKVVSASRYEQKSSEIAGSPQLIKADEIRSSGARNLGEALSLFGGVHLHNDGIYTRLGVRGFLRIGDFNARILLLLDGRRLNELAYDGAYLGEEGPIDVSLIERLEFIPGPGSSVYGSNAFFGVINIITKKSADLPAAQVNLEITERQRLRYEGGLALRFDHGASGQLQVSHYESPGRQRSAQELARAANATPAGRDKEWANRFYGRYDDGALSLSAVYVNREVNNANGAYLTTPDALQPNRDRLANVDLAYSKEVAPSLTLATHLGSSDYKFRSFNLADEMSGGTGDNEQISRARWLDADIKAIAKWRPDSTLVAGFEVTRVTNLDFEVLVPSLKKVLVDQQSRFTRWGVYAQNDWVPTSSLTLSLGLRLDGQTGRDAVLSPRIGAIYRPSNSSALKLQHGVAFRNPNAYELNYNAPEAGYRTNPSLREERVTSNELTFEQEFGQRASLRISAFNNKVDKLIDFLVDPSDGILVFSNIGSATVKGVQADMQLALPSDWFGGSVDGWRARLSATIQRGESIDATSTNGDRSLRNSPRSLAHLAVYTPHWQVPTIGGGAHASLMGSLTWQYVGSQQGRDMTVDSYSILNATLVADGLWPGISATLGVKNLLDRSYSYPLGDEYVQTGERGGVRTFWLGARYRFK
jgi:outer membrane receptor protein involved in Fe transport